MASHLDSDRDLCNFRLTCHSANEAVDHDNYSFWRRRFMSTFEKPSWSSKPNVEYKRQYKRRKNALLYGARFDVAIKFARAKEIPKAIRALEVLKEMLLGMKPSLTPRYLDRTSS